MGQGDTGRKRPGQGNKIGVDGRLGIRMHFRVMGHTDNGARGRGTRQRGQILKGLVVHTEGLNPTPKACRGSAGF